MPAYANLLRSTGLDDASSEFVVSFLDSASDLSSEESTQLHILENHGSSLQKASADVNEVAKAPPGVNTRVIVLAYPDLEDLHRPTLDKLVATLELPPLVSWRHLNVDTMTIKEWFPLQSRIHR